MKYKLKSKANVLFLPAWLLVVASLFGGCSSELTFSDADGNPVNGLVPIQVYAGLNADVDVPDTRAASTITTNGAKMGVFRIAEASKGYTAVNNVEYTYSTATSLWTNAGNPILVGGLSASLCAYYPYGATTFSGTNATLSAQKYADAKVFWFATNGGNDITNKTPSASFAMTHAYSRVTLNITRDATYSAAMGSCKINQVGFKPVAGTLSAVTSLDISKAMSAQSPAASSGLLYNTVSADDIYNGINIGAVKSIDLLIPPTTVSAEILLSVTVDGEARAVAIPAAALGTLTAGKQYAIQAKIVGLALLQLQSVALINQNWNTIPTTPNGSFEEVKPQ